VKESIYFDHAATSFPKPVRVMEKMCEYMKNVCNVGRGGYAGAYSAEETVYETREKLKELFHAKSSKNVVFTPNITTSLNMVLKGLLKPGNRVLVSSVEHNAVMRPLHQLEKSGVIVEKIAAGAEGTMDMGDFLRKVETCVQCVRNDPADRTDRCRVQKKKDPICSGYCCHGGKHGD